MRNSLALIKNCLLKINFENINFSILVYQDFFFFFNIIYLNIIYFKNYEFSFFYQLQIKCYTFYIIFINFQLIIYFINSHPQLKLQYNILKLTLLFLC